MKFNAQNCHVMEIGVSKIRPRWSSKTVDGKEPKTIHMISEVTYPLLITIIGNVLYWCLELIVGGNVTKKHLHLYFCLRLKWK